MILRSCFNLVGRAHENFSRRNFTATNAVLSTSRTDLVKLLRRKTGASISLCLEALNKNDNDPKLAEEAVLKFHKENNYERLQRCDSDVHPGLVGILTDASMKFGLIAKMNCQTDFVAKSDVFIESFKDITEMIARDYLRNFEYKVNNKVNINYDDIKSTQHKLNEIITVEEKLNQLSSTIKEKVLLDDITALQLSTDYYLGSYVHWPSKNEIDAYPFTFRYGRIGSLCVISNEDPVMHSSPDQDYLQRKAKELAIHIVGMLPSSIHEEKNQESATSSVSEKSDAEISVVDTDDYVGNSLMNQPFFTRPSITVSTWCLNNKIAVNDFLLIEYQF